MNRLPIRFRITFWYAASLITLLILFGTVISVLMSRSLLARTDEELREELQELLLEIDLSSNPSELAQQLRLRFGNHETFQFQVLNESQEIVFTSQKLPAHLRLMHVPGLDDRPHFENLTLDSDHQLRVAAQMVRGPAGPLLVQVLIPLDRNLAELHDLRFSLLMAAVPLILASILGGYWLAVRSLSPLDAMVRSARRISAVQSRERLGILNPGDEIGRLGLTLNQMIDRLQSSVDEQLQFTADAAHELRTPLAVIRSTAELALRNSRTEDYYQECLHGILEATERLTLLADHLLVLAREDSQPAVSNPEVVSLATCLMGVIDDLEPLAGGHELQVHHQIDPELLVTGDAARFRRVFLNLLENAIKFTPPGGTIDITTTVDRDRVLVTVSDTGIGIPASDLPHVFRRFYRVENSRTRDQGGSGLGLAIAKAILMTHGGTIEILSDPGRGTQVLVKLPLQPADRTVARLDYAHF